MMSAILLDKLQNYRLVKLHDIPLDLTLLSHIKEAVLTAVFVSPGILWFKKEKCKFTLIYNTLRVTLLK